MATSKKTFKEGINLKPIDLPNTAVEGDLYISDGTTNPVGLHQYLGGVWTAIPVPGSVDPQTAINTSDISDNTAAIDNINSTPYIHATRTNASASINYNTATISSYACPEILESNKITFNSSGFEGYICDEQGLYTISAAALFQNSTAWQEAELVQLITEVYDSLGSLVKSAVLDRRFQDTGLASVSGTTTFRVPAGGSIRFTLEQRSGVTLTLFQFNTPIYNYITIAKVGE